jgi:3-hydroxyisobutyrate dehydrogenase-like beta-hydroxyacid dehydrogenase
MTTASTLRLIYPDLIKDQVRTQGSSPAAAPVARFDQMRRVVAIIGTGICGSAMVRRLRRAGIDVRAWNRTPAKAEALAGDGVSVAGSPREAVSGAPVVAIVVMDEPAVDAVLSGSDGLLAGLDHGALVVDFTTTSVPAKLRFDSLVRDAGGRFAEAPFFGSKPELEGPGIWPAVGASAEDMPDVERALRPLCKDIFHIGAVGEASAFKLAANLLVFTMVGNLAESLALARALGVDTALLVDVLSRGTGVRAPLYAAKGRLVLDGDYEARASVGLATKDLELITTAAREAGVRLPLTETARRLFERAAAAGLEDEDMIAVYKLLDSGGNADVG